MFSFELLADAIVLGLLLGCFYAAVSLGLSLAFGLLDVPHLAYPAFLVLGAYGTYMLYELGIDPLIAGVLLMPPFFLLGVAMYRIYYETFEKRGSDAGVRGLAFFFGVAFVIEVCIILAVRRRPAHCQCVLYRHGRRCRRHAHSDAADRGLRDGAGAGRRHDALSQPYLLRTRHPRRRPG